MEDYRLEQTGQQVQDILNGAAMQTDLTAEVDRAEGAEGVLQQNIDEEELARQNADGILQGNIDAEETRAKAAEKQNADDIDAIEGKIPSGASSENKLATESYVDDSVATATATFRGTFNLVSDLHLTLSATEGQIATALAGAIATADNNDYCFVQIPTSTETPTEIARIDRYKFNGTAWAFEYSLNNSGFTAAQWASINSGITSGLVAKLGDLPTASALATALAGKQDTLTFDNAPTENSQNPVKSGGVYTAVHNEAETRSVADAALQAAIEGILALIPSAATALNQLADKAFVNSSIATASATFRGTYNLVSDLSLEVDATHAQIATALLTAISTADNNDYAFVQIPTSAETPTEIRVTERYKFNGTAWAYEYDLNNSGFTAAQWAAINSGITLALVTKLGALPTNSELTDALAGKQNVLTFDSAPVSGSQNPVYSGGLYTLFAAIDAKMPAGAGADNKLVAENRLAAYVAAIIGALDASYNVTSTDGHVSVNITQVDGAITSLQVLTSDIASASALTTLTGVVNTKAAQSDLLALSVRVSTNETEITTLQAAYAALTESDIVVGALPSSGVANTIYRVPGTSSYTDYMWYNGVFVPMATYNNAIDNVPTKDSNNLVKSGGVAKLLQISKDISLQLQDLDDCCHDVKAWNYNGGNPVLINAIDIWTASDFIELPSDAISNGFSITNLRCHTSQGYHLGYYFDQNLQYLGYMGTGSEGNVSVDVLNVASTSIPSGAKYIIFNGNKQANGSYCSFSALKKYIKNLSETKANIENLVPPIFLRYTIPFYEKVKAINDSNTIINAIDTWGYTDYFEIISEDFQVLRLEHVHDYQSNAISFGYAYDASKNFLGKFSSPVTTEKNDFSIDIKKSDLPTGTKYVRFNGNPQVSNGVTAIFYNLGGEIIKDLAKQTFLSSVNRQIQNDDDCCFESKAWSLNGIPSLGSAVDSWKASDYIELPSDAITNGFSITNVRCHTAYNYHIGYFFDENLKYLGYMGTGTEGDTIIALFSVASSEIPVGTKYIVFNGYDYSRSLCSFSKLKASLLPNVDSADKLFKLQDNPIKVITREVGFTSIFLNWGFIGDSLASGEYNCKLNGEDTHYDAYDFSWGQFICRLTGAQGYNFSVGAQTAHGWINGADERAWGGAQNNPKTSYIIALGHNDITLISESYPVGTSEDVNLSDYTQNANSFFGDYAGIIQRLRSIQPNVPIFCCTTFNGWGGDYDAINNAIRSCVALFDHVYLLDMYQYFPRVDGTWGARYRHSSHFTAQGYLEVAWGIMNYIDFVVRHNWDAFKNQGLIGTEYTF